MIDYSILESLAVSAYDSSVQAEDYIKSDIPSIFEVQISFSNDEKNHLNSFFQKSSSLSQSYLR
jgi:hypothetical protein